MKGMPSSSARAWPWAVLTARFSSQSHLLPMRILFTPSLACCSTLENQVRMSVLGVSILMWWWEEGGVVLTVETLLICDIVDE